MKVILVLLMYLCWEGCAMMPSYHRPLLPVSADFPYSKEEGSAAPLGWRQFFASARLLKLIEIALQNNRDLRVAALNVEQVKAQYRVLRFALLPSFESNADGQRQKDVSSEGSYSTTSNYTATIDTAYEVDFFGRIRSLKAQVLEQYFATVSAQRAIHIALVAEVANQYLTQLAFDEHLAIARRTLKSQEAYYRLIQGSYQLGQASDLDLRLAQTQVESARSGLANFERQRAQAEDALVFLIGRPLPGDLPPAQRFNASGLIADIPAGLPSDLLERRPDILEAEHALKGAHANIGAVRAAFFPRVVLTASAGTASAQLSDLFKSGTGIWSFAPQINVPLFNRSNNIANLHAAQIKRSMEVARYEKVVQAAFREVSDGLIAKQTFERQVQAELAVVKAQARRCRLAKARYRHGIDNYFSVLRAREDLYQARQKLTQTQLLRQRNLITFYKSLGGGWQE